MPFSSYIGINPPNYILAVLMACKLKFNTDVALSEEFL
jgi:hypothetical protein